MKNKIKKYWDKRSKNGLLAGSNTVLADLLEINYISSQIKKKRTILDAGCGNGIFLKRISKKTKYKFAIGIDYSEEMIENAKKFKLKKASFITADMSSKKQIGKINNKFDYIITKRSLINLRSFKSQTNTIDLLSSLLTKNGILLCCENSSEGLKRINITRKKLGLKKIIAPWHNKYIDDSKIKKHKFKFVKIKKIHEFSSSFYFLSRIVNAYLTKIEKKNFLIRI